MRQIKFRAWDGEKFYSPIIGDGKVFRNGRCYEDFTPCSDVVQQYTSLKDKNGVEIYEGDIVRFMWNSWNDGGMGDRLKVMPIEWRGDEAKFIIPSIDNHTEVIGNICENPELLD